MRIHIGTEWEGINIEVKRGGDKYRDRVCMYMQGGSRAIEWSTPGAVLDIHSVLTVCPSHARCSPWTSLQCVCVQYCMSVQATLGKRAIPFAAMGVTPYIREKPKVSHG